VALGVRRDVEDRYVRGDVPATPNDPVDAARRFVRVYGPARMRDYAQWAGIPVETARRHWDAIADECEPVARGTAPPVLASVDVAVLERVDPVTGVRLLPAGDPFLQAVNREHLAPDATVRRRLFRPASGPGAVIVDGALAGMWRARARRGRLVIEVEKLAAIPAGDLAREAATVAAARGLEDPEVTIS